MQMADGDGERVGGVGRIRNVGEREQAHDHELDLLLGSETVAHDGAFDRERGVLGDDAPALGGGKQRDSAHLAELERGLGVGGEENVFDGDGVRVVKGDAGREFGVDLVQALGGGVLLLNADGAGVHVRKLRDARGLVEVHDAVAGELGAAIDAEDAHGGILPVRWRAEPSFDGTKTSSRTKGDFKPDQQSDQSGNVPGDDQPGGKREADRRAESPGGPEDEGKQEEGGKLQKREAHASHSHKEVGRACLRVPGAGGVGRLSRLERRVPGTMPHGEHQGKLRGNPDGTGPKNADPAQNRSFLVGVCGFHRLL